MESGATKKVENKNTFVYAFKQQIMKAWQPVPTIHSTICLFTILGAFFLSFGIALIILTQKIEENSVRYDDTCNEIHQTCSVNINILNTMEPPVFFYYEMENFFQNHRRYVKSRDNEQLKGTIKSVGELSACTPIVTMRDLGINLAADNQTTLDWDAPASPCGLIAKSLFNDTYQIFRPNNKTSIKISYDGIAWPADKANKFARAGKDWNKTQWTDVTDERFIVWMRTAALSSFRKIWGRIDETLEPGNYTILVENNYNVKPFNGKKTIVLSTTNAFGGKNTFLAVAYLVVGSVCMLIAIAFTLKKILSRREAKNK